MAITNEFMEAVKIKNIMRIRIMLKDSLLVDPTGVEFDEMERYAEELIDDIYMKHDGEALNYDTSSWNEAYFNEQMVIMINEFSKERVALLKEMTRYLHENQLKRKPVNSNSCTISHKQLGSSAVVVGAVLAATGICTSHSIMTIGGIVVAATGVGLIVRGGNK